MEEEIRDKKKEESEEETSEDKTDNKNAIKEKIKTILILKIVMKKNNLPLIVLRMISSISSKKIKMVRSQKSTLIHREGEETDKDEA